MLFINRKKKKIALLFLCLGKDNDFFNEIHSSFEKFFLPKLEKHYFVFTDEIKRYRTSKHVYPFDVHSLPEPLNEVLKIHHFLSKEDLYNGYDYMAMVDTKYFVSQKINDKDLLPRSILNERFSFLIDHRFDNLHIEEYPYERNHESKAFVNYNRGKYYISDSLVVGEASAFLDMCHELDDNILADLNNNYICKDVIQTHLNKYIVNIVDCRYIDRLDGLFNHKSEEIKNDEENSDNEENISE